MFSILAPDESGSHFLHRLVDHRITGSQDHKITDYWLLYMMNAQEICQQLDPSAFKLILNESLPKYDVLIALLAKHNIPFEPTNAKQTFSLGTIQMGFGLSCRFQDVYYLAFLFSAFGLRTVYPLNVRKPEIQFGTYLHKFRRKQWVDFILGDPLDIHTFLAIDPKLSMKEVMDLHFDDSYKTSYADEVDRDKLQSADAYHGSTELDENRLDDAYEEEE